MAGYASWRLVVAARRRGALACVLTGLLALGIALWAENDRGMVPCALCLVERWPYRALVALGIVGLLLPRSFGRTVLSLAICVGLVSLVLGGGHVGVEMGWWPSPLPECAAPSLPHGSIAERLAAMPAVPTKPCDAPAYIWPRLPLSMAAMNMVYALLFTVALSVLMRGTGRPKGDQRVAAKKKDTHNDEPAAAG